MESERFKVNQNIAILDAHGFYGIGLRQVIQKSEEFSQSDVIIFKSKAEFIKSPLSVFRIVILDAEMKDMEATDLFRQIRGESQETELLVLVREPDHIKNTEWIHAGIKGIISRECEPDEMQFAVNMLHKGKCYYDSGVLLEQTKSGTKKGKVQLPAGLVLDSTDLEMIRLIADEYTQVEMNKILNLPTSTIMYLRRRLFSKLKVKNTAGLMRKVIQYGLID